MGCILCKVTPYSYIIFNPQKVTADFRIPCIWVRGVSWWKGCEKNKMHEKTETWESVWRGTETCWCPLKSKIYIYYEVVLFLPLTFYLIYYRNELWSHWWIDRTNVNLLLLWFWYRYTVFTVSASKTKWQCGNVVPTLKKIVPYELWAISVTAYFISVQLSGFMNSQQQHVTFNKHENSHQQVQSFSCVRLWLNT